MYYIKKSTQGWECMKKEKLKEKVISNFKKEEFIDLLSDIIKIPSHKEVDWQEDKIANYLYDYLKINNIDEVKLDYIKENRPNVIAKIKGKSNGKSLMLNGHLDTIPPYSMIIPAYKPVIKNGYIQGRGVVDMKGPLASMIMALTLIKKAKIELAGDVYFTGVIDQEQRSIGTVNLIEKNLKTDFAVVGEPTNLKICKAHKGMEWIKIIVKGKSVHGSTPEKGYNPIYHASRIATEIEKFNKKLKEKVNEVVGYSTINVGVISGGNDPNIVPNVTHLEVDRRYTNEENREKIYEEIEKIIAKLKTSNPNFETEVIPMNDRICPLGNLPFHNNDDNILFKSLKKSTNKYTNNESEVTSFRGWSDAALLDNKLGINSVIFGPGLTEKCHAADEKIKISELVKAVKIYISLIIDICS